MTNFKNSNYSQYPFIIFVEDANIKMKLSEQSYHNNISVEFDFGYDKQLSTEVCLLDVHARRAF